MIQSNLDRLAVLTEEVSPGVSDIARLVVELLADSIAIVDSGGSLVYVSPLLQTLFGYTSEELIGQPIEILVDDIKEAHVALRNGFLTDATVARRMSDELILSGQTKTNEQISLMIGITPLKWGGADSGAIAVIRRHYGV